MEEESVGSFTALSSCLIHFRGKTGDLCKLTCHTLVKIKEYCEKWINLDGEPKEIAEKIIDVVRSWPDNEPDVLPTEAADFRYHKECYVRFCDKNKVARSMKKKEKAPVRDVKEQSMSKTWSEKRCSSRIASFVCASASTQPSTSTITERRSIHVLPVQCIICKRKDAYIMDKVQVFHIMCMFIKV